MSYQPTIAEFIASNKRKRDDEVLQLSDVPGDSSNEDDGDDTDKEKSNPEALPKKKKRIALRESNSHGSRKWIVCITARSALLNQLPVSYSIHPPVVVSPPGNLLRSNLLPGIFVM